MSQRNPLHLEPDIVPITCVWKSRVLIKYLVDDAPVLTEEVKGAVIAALSLGTFFVTCPESTYYA